MPRSKIDWTDETINPFTGCHHGCSFCYARKMANRQIHMPGGKKYRRVAKHGVGNPFWPAFHMDVLAHERDRLERIRKPRRVFVGSMGEMCFDLRAVAFDGRGRSALPIDSEMLQGTIAEFCADLPGHTFQLLTKRPDLLSHKVEWGSNVHLGVSVSKTDDAHRIATLLDKKAVGTGSQGGGRWHPQMKLWASVEPLLDRGFNPYCLRGLDWVVIGAKTGGRKVVPGLIVRAAARIMEWCAAADVPCFVKDNMRKADLNYNWPREFPTTLARR